MQDSGSQSWNRAQLAEYAVYGNLLAELLSLEHWTQTSLEGKWPRGPAPADSSRTQTTLESTLRALYTNRVRHAVLCGEPSIGKTELVKLLARQIADGDIEFLRDHRLFRIDCRLLTPEESRTVLDDLFGMLAQSEERIILFVEGLPGLLKRPDGRDNRQALLAALARTGIRMIAELTPWEYRELIAPDPQMREAFKRIDVAEPSEEAARAILDIKAEEMSEQFGLTIPTDVRDKALSLSQNYLLNEHLPGKAIRLLEDAAEHVDFGNAQLGEKRESLTTDDIVHIVAGKTGLPEETLRGEGASADFEQMLKRQVLGQDRAVTAVAKELRLIRAGLSQPGKPAAVWLFAGLTGVGKTELAKQVARLYSAGKKLTTYSMGNYTEPHSVSGIIGVPPGYVGHEEGGRLVNELIADPHGVFLLDEAEKPHPNVWKPFLNLFDEGWIADQRGMKAHADRAVFILTTNAGDRAIAQMLAQDKSEEEITRHVRQTLSRVRHERSGQPIFPAQFLARLGRILVFGALDEASMIGITEKMSRELADRWLTRRGKQVIVSEELIESIGKEAHRLNQESNGQEGGRIVRRLMTDLVESQLQDAAVAEAAEYRAATEIRVGLSGEELVEGVQVEFGATR